MNVMQDKEIYCGECEIFLYEDTAAMVSATRPMRYVVAQTSVT